MPLPTYENQSTWKEIQKFLPESTHFYESHTPVEERWGNRSHTIHLDRWRSSDAKVRVIMHHGLGTDGRQVSLLFVRHDKGGRWNKSRLRGLGHHR